MHCASQLRMNFASLARADERVRVQNIRDFPQAKLGSETNVRFLLNGHGRTPTYKCMNLTYTRSSTVNPNVKKRLRWGLKTMFFQTFFWWLSFFSKPQRSIHSKKALGLRLWKICFYPKTVL